MCLEYAIEYHLRVLGATFGLRKKSISSEDETINVDLRLLERVL